MCVCVCVCVKTSVVFCRNIPCGLNMFSRSAVVVMVLAAACSPMSATSHADHHAPGAGTAPRVDIFHKILELEGTHGAEVLTVTQLQNVINKVSANLRTHHEEEEDDSHGSEEEGEGHEEGDHHGACVYVLVSLL